MGIKNFCLLADKLIEPENYTLKNAKLIEGGV